MSTSGIHSYDAGQRKKKMLTRRSLLKVGALAAPAIILPPKLILPNAGRAAFNTFSASRPLSFYTNFADAPENPISEGGVWFKPSNVNANLRTVASPNRVIGTQAGTGSFNDSYAQSLLGFKPNVDLWATVYKDPSLPNSNGPYELELHLRFSRSGTTPLGYECNWSCGGFYSQIARWDPGSFTFLAQIGSFTAPNTGDRVRARIVGGTIWTYIQYAVANGGDGSTWNFIQSATDNTYTTGDPGIAMWLGTGAMSDQLLYGFTDCFITEI